MVPMADELLAKISEKIAGYENEMVEFSKTIIGIPAISPKEGGKGESQKAAYIENILRQWGFDDITHYDAPDELAPGGKRPNFVVRMKGKDPSRTLWLVAHLDIVPPGDLKKWTCDPYQACVKDGKIYGRGSEDNGQALVATCFAFRAMRELGISPAVNVALLLGSDEETGSDKGVLHMMDKDVFKKGDVFLVPDGGNPAGTLLEVSEKTIMWLKFTVEGKQCHGSMPQRGNNAHRAGMKLALELDRVLHKKYGKRNKLFDPPVSTFEPTKKEANVPNINTVPGEDIFYFDTRILPEFKPADVEKLIAATVKRIAKATRTKIKYEKMQFAPAAPPTSPDAPVVKALAQSVKAVYKNKPYAGGIGGGTFAAIFRRAGYDAVVWSRLDDTCHGPDEYAWIKFIVGDSKVCALLMATFN
ncbi:MAG: M20 family metallo-hydrolase [Euryarchaeota archaeon]|nr:M20 family metallo-hydrolase [Euryarchaeota archaeon]